MGNLNDIIGSDEAIARKIADAQDEWRAEKRVSEDGFGWLTMQGYTEHCIALYAKYK